MSTVRLIATDLDGTILRSDGTVSDRTRAALAAAERAGIAVVLVTGRPPRWLAPVAEAVGHRGMAVCSNGAFVYDLATERVLTERLVSPEVALQVARALTERFPDACFAVERPHGFSYTPPYRSRWPQPSATVSATVAELMAEPAAKLLVRHDGSDPDALLAAAEEVLGELVTCTHSSPDGLLEVSAAGVTKASGLAELCAERGVAAADVVAFGDMPNDLPMLAWAGWSVAVANAHPAVLAAADEVVAGHDEDGVAQAVERLVAAPQASRRPSSRKPAATTAVASRR